MDFNSFVGAISGQESGGSYGAVNGRTGALGRYQILPGNVSPWARQYLGISVTPTQFLHSPALQERLARAVLKSYYDKWGARGAAAAWYSGSPKGASNYTRSRSNEPSIGEYVDSVLGRAGGPSPYGYTPGKQTDNRVAQSSLAGLLDQGPTDAPKPIGIEAADKAAAGVQAAQPGVGMEASVPTQSADQPELAQSLPFMGANTGKASGQRAALIDMAKQFVGTPYRWGHADPRTGFDCSGLIQYAMKSIGVNFPRVSFDQLAMGHKTAVNKLQPGDLVGFGNGGHIAIYLGGGQILEAPRTGLDVRIRSLGKGENAWGVSLDGIYR